eukprot:2687874-Rhodomonas_salina.1
MRGRVEDEAVTSAGREGRSARLGSRRTKLLGRVAVHPRGHDPPPVQAVPCQHGSFPLRSCAFSLRCPVTCRYQEPLYTFFIAVQ